LFVSRIIKETQALQEEAIVKKDNELKRVIDAAAISFSFKDLTCPTARTLDRNFERKNFKSRENNWPSSGRKDGANQWHNQPHD